MTKKTLSTLQDQWWDRDRADWVEDLFDSLVQVDDVPRAADAGTGYALWVSKGGDDTAGNGDQLDPYATIGQALSQAGGDKLVVFVEPGTYQEAVEWPAVNNVRLIGLGGLGAVTIVDPSSGGTAVLKAAPGTAFGAQFNAHLENVSIDHNGTGIIMQNTSMDDVFQVEMKDVEFVKSGGTSLISQSGTAQPMKIHMKGSRVDVGGEVNLQIAHADDEFIVDEKNLSGGLVTDNGSAFGGTAEITFNHCEVLHEGVSGGHADQRINAVKCTSRTGETIAALDTNDLAGSHTENIIG